TRIFQPIPTLIAFVAVWGVFLVALHPWLMNWGTTRDEQAMVLPGDNAPPADYFTRAISIDAPPSVVWAWLHAIGQDRGGFFSNDWLENLALADIHNADTLRPEWQQRSIGDRVPMTGVWERSLGGDGTLTTINLLVPESAYGDAPTRFVLVPMGADATRLLIREKLAGPE